jgi:Glycosyl hydrolases family 39
VHFAGLSDRWTNSTTRTWDEAKIKAGYDASYPHRPTIIQNIPRWPKWMKTNPDGTLTLSDHQKYADFCAQLVEILNRRQKRNILYWEPLNENDVDYHKAGKLNELWALYNQVASAMKAKDSRIKVGGPALTWDEPSRMADFLRTCKANVDFISWHRYGSGDAKESTDTLMAYTPKYGEQVKMFRKMVEDIIPDRKVPLLLGEYNVNYSWQSGENRQNTHIGAVWFASVLKHLSEANIDMATSWHLKDGIYGMIDPDNRLRPAATVFTWGLRYFVGDVVQTRSDRDFVEAFAVRQTNNKSLLLINKSSQAINITVNAQKGATSVNKLFSFALDQNGTKKVELTSTNITEPFSLSPYSLRLFYGFG